MTRQMLLLDIIPQKCCFDTPSSHTLCLCYGTVAASRDNRQKAICGDVHVEDIYQS